MGAPGVITVMAVVVMAALATVAADYVTNDAFLTAHNDARRAVGVPALKWHYGLEKAAQDYVNRVGCTVTSPGKSGVNLYLTGVPGLYSRAMPYWLEEKKFYKYSSNSCTSYCAHYTQIVWKKTQYLGCGYYKCGNGGVFVACLYSPSGNIPGQKPY